MEAGSSAASRTSSDTVWCSLETGTESSGGTHVSAREDGTGGTTTPPEPIPPLALALHTPITT